MDYRESLDFLYGLQRFGIKLGLDNIRSLLAALGHPERAYLSVHVAGTNGKGSVCATLAEVLRCAGYRVGLYTSPHLQSFCERICVDGVMIDEESVACLTADLRQHCATVPATFFEFTTALAFKYFADRQVDVAILETGLGGRLDATNAVTPILSVITPVAFDHCHILGASLQEIAAEKGGIIKDRVPVVIGRQDPAAAEVLLTMAAQHHAPAQLWGRDFSAEVVADGAVCVTVGDVGSVPLTPALPGRHQHDNLALAVAALRQLAVRGLPWSDEALTAGVAAVRWPGRLEWWGDDRSLLLDGAHNPAGAQALAAYLHDAGYTNIRWVVGIKGDKDAAAILAPLLPLTKVLYATVPPVEDAVVPEQLAAFAAGHGVDARLCSTPAAALSLALRERVAGEIVLVAGSLFLVAAARAWLLSGEGRP